MNNTILNTIKENFPQYYQKLELSNHIIKSFPYWTPDDWRNHFNSQKYNNFKVAPIGLINSATFASLKNYSQVTLIFALTQITFEPKKRDKRHNSNRHTPTNIKTNLFTLPIAALQAIGVGSKNTCRKAIAELANNNILIKLPNQNKGKPNLYQFSDNFISQFVCV